MFSRRVSSCFNVSRLSCLQQADLMNGGKWWVSSSSSSINKEKELQITVCGSGSGAHAFVVTAASKFSPRYRVNWYSINGNTNNRISKTLNKNDGYLQGVFVQENALVYGKPNIVSNDASQVIPDSDIIVLCVPAYSHTQYLKEINKHMTPNKKSIIAAFPSACGLEFAFRKLITNWENTVLFNCLTLPWACRTTEYGSKVEILGIKDSISNYVAGSNELLDEMKPLEKLQSIFLDNKPLLECDTNVNIYSSTVGSMNPPIHLSIMYHQWKYHNSKQTYDDKPLFYHGISKECATFLSYLSDEMLLIAEKYNELGGGMIDGYRDISFVHVKDWYLQSYGLDCTDTSSLYGLIRTNPAYNGLTHPMSEVEVGVDGSYLSDNQLKLKTKTKYAPNFQFRYLTEDVPYGLLVIKAMQIMLNESQFKYGISIDTPHLDTVLIWAEKVLNKKYFIKNNNNDRIVNIDMTSDDILKSRVPQMFGFESVDDILKFC